MIVVYLRFLNSSSIHDLTMNKTAGGFALYKKWKCVFGCNCAPLALGNDAR
jgi:hypothetical protein